MSLEKTYIVDDYLALQKKFQKKYGKDTFLLYQVGSFAEAYAISESQVEFLKDVCSKINIVLTRKNKSDTSIPSKKNPHMAGFTKISYDKYISMLLKLGYTVVRYDQHKCPTTDEVTRFLFKVYSPSMCIDLVTDDTSRFMSVYLENNSLLDTSWSMGVTIIDLSTGKEVLLFEQQSVDIGRDLYDICLTYGIKECLLTLDGCELPIDNLHLECKVHSATLNREYKKLACQNERFSQIFMSHIKNSTLSPIETLDLEMYGFARLSLMCCLDFAQSHDPTLLNHLVAPTYVQMDSFMQMHYVVDKLNIFGSKHTLYGMLSKYVSTVMGRRLLHDRLIHPLFDRDKILKRLQQVEEIKDRSSEIVPHLKSIVDVERLFRRLALGKLHPFELFNLYVSLEEIIHIYEKLSRDTMEPYDSLVACKKRLSSIFNMNIMSSVRQEDMSRSIFHPGQNPEIDAIESEISKHIEWFHQVAHHIGGTDIPIKIETSDQDGTFFSCTNKRYKYLEKRWSKNEPIAIGSHTFTFSDLNEHTRTCKSKICLKGSILRKVSDEQILLTDKLKKISLDLYRTELQYIHSNFHTCIENMLLEIAEIDIAVATHRSSTDNRYVVPLIKGSADSASYFAATQLRHPISEHVDQDTKFVPHDIQLGIRKASNKIQSNDSMIGMMLNSPNASGKSVLLKSVGVAILMAQIGWHVPADSFELSPYKHIGCRAGHTDDILRGHSTFTVEMKELKKIMKVASKNTFCMLDEIAASTEYPSAMAIQIALVKHLCDNGANFIFATHIHKLHEQDEMIQLGSLIRFYNLYVETHPTKGLIYHRTLREGALDKLYGLEVAHNIIMDQQFNELALKVRNRYTNNQDMVMHASKYNKDKMVYRCEICGKIPKDGETPLDTHHIDFQCNADEDGFIGHMKKDVKSNLVTLCKDHHQAVHNGSLLIHGYQKTTRGIVLEFETVDKKPTKRRKYKSEQIKIIEDLKNHAKTRAIAMRLLRSEHKLTVSSKIVKDIWEGKY